MKFYSLLFIVACILVAFLGCFMHEKVHLAINDLYDAQTDGQIHLNWDGAYVNVNSSTCNDSCRLAHSINEVVGYNLQGLYCLIALGFFIIIIILEGK